MHIYGWLVQQKKEEEEEEGGGRRVGRWVGEEGNTHVGVMRSGLLSFLYLTLCMHNIYIQ
jgi:hypothetical protein